MKPLVRATPKSSASRTKVLLVRPAIKSVRQADEPDRTWRRLVIGNVDGQLYCFGASAKESR